jgi:anti-sigma factor RsiW
MSMTCGEVGKVLEAFVDGELPGSSMRAVARHLANCAACESVSAHFERVQEALRHTVLSAASEPAAEAFWNTIAPRLGSARRPLWAWLGSMFQRPWADGLPVPVWVGGAAAAVLIATVLLWSGGWPGGPSPDPHYEGRLVLRQQARIDSLEAAGNVRVWNQPGTGALVIWVDDGGLNVERLDP